MISYHFSPPGSGKTYHVIVNEIIPALKAGRHVYTNIDGVDLREISLIIGVPVAQFNFHKVTRKEEVERLFAANHDDPQCLTLQAEKGALLVIDEAEAMWLNRQWESTAQTFIYFLKYHRHVDCDVVFMGTYLESFDKALRNVGGMYYSYMNYKFLGVPLASGKYRVKMRLDADAQPLVTSTYKFEVKYFRCYRSALQVTQQLNKKFPIPKQVYVLAACVIFCIWAFAGVSRVSMFKWARPSAVPPAPPAAKAAPTPISPYGDFIKEINKNDTVPNTMPELPRPSSLPQNVRNEPAACVPNRKKVGGCYEMGGQKECVYEYKEVCE